MINRILALLSGTEGWRPLTGYEGGSSVGKLVLVYFILCALNPLSPLFPESTARSGLESQSAGRTAAEPVSSPMPTLPLPGHVSLSHYCLVEM